MTSLWQDFFIKVAFEHIDLTCLECLIYVPLLPKIWSSSPPPRNISPSLTPHKKTLYLAVVIAPVPVLL